MRNIPFALMWLGVLALAAACVPGNVVATKPAGPDVAAPAVTGSVTSLQNSAVPATAVLEVQLQDVSLADAPAEVISARTIETKGRQLPIRYVLAYDPQKINQAHRYSMRATIKDGDKLLFTSTQAYPVITNGAPSRGVEIVVEPVAAQSGAAAPSVITGTVTYRNSSALPAGAVLEVSLQDISRAGAPALPLAVQRIDVGGQQPPFTYALPYDPAQIDPRYTYSVSARITHGSELLYISDTANLVLTRDAPVTDVNIVVTATSR